MPRPEQTRLRRILMQSIMWIILAGTIALAALVDHQRNRAVSVELGEPRRVGEFSVQLPADWIGDADADSDSNSITLTEPYADAWARTLQVAIRKPSLGDALTALVAGQPEGRTVESKNLRIDGAEYTLVIHRLPIVQAPRRSLYQTRITATRQLPAGRALVITLDGFSRSGKKDIDRDVDLISRVCQSVKTDATQ